MMRCKYCGKELKGHKRMFCNRKCQAKNRYLTKRQDIIDQSAEWQRKNPEKAKISHKKAWDKWISNNRDKFNKRVLKNYYENRNKWDTRCLTYQLFKRNKNPLIVEKKCIFCSSKNNVRLKFTIYPPTCDGIRKAFNKNKIYYRCESCRSRRKKK